MAIATTRPAAVAGLFYPDDPAELRQWIETALEDARTTQLPARAIVVPHAGYIYSGATAAKVYAELCNRKVSIHRVVLLGPAHRVGFQGVAIPSVDSFKTPLGEILLDRPCLTTLSNNPHVISHDLAHAHEHSLEVQLPFLQVALSNFTLVPLLIGNADVELLVSLLQTLWHDEQTLFVVSSDLSHYHSYRHAQQLDKETSAMIESCEDFALSAERACGYLPLRALLQTAKLNDLQGHTLDLCNSGDTAGSKDRVVGYGAYAFR